MKLRHAHTIEQLKLPPVDFYADETELDWAIWQPVDGKDVTLKDKTRPGAVLIDSVSCDRA